MQKYFRHQGAKTRSLLLTIIFSQCLGVFVAILSGYPGLGSNLPADQSTNAEIRSSLVGIWKRGIPKKGGELGLILRRSRI